MKIGLVGYQGSGKSTLFQWLTGIEPDPAKAREALAEYDRLAPTRMQPYLRLMFDLFLSDPIEREEVLANLDTVDHEVIRLTGQWGKALLPDQAWVEDDPDQASFRERKHTMTRPPGNP